MSEACEAQWLEQSTSNRKTWDRIPAQSKNIYSSFNLLSFKDILIVSNLIFHGDSRFQRRACF